jgi:hypothetical protein
MRVLQGMHYGQFNGYIFTCSTITVHALPQLTHRRWLRRGAAAIWTSMLLLLLVIIFLLQAPRQICEAGLR